MARRGAHIPELRLSSGSHSRYWEAFLRRLQIMTNSTTTAPIPARILIVATSIVHSLDEFDSMFMTAFRRWAPNLGS